MRVKRFLVKYPEKVFVCEGIGLKIQGRKFDSIYSLDELSSKEIREVKNYRRDKTKINKIIKNLKPINLNQLRRNHPGQKEK